ncbi:uncharacterized protein METZ01_LOCUS287670, partial [marine metagenome]
VIIYVISGSPLLTFTDLDTHEL